MKKVLENIKNNIDIIILLISLIFVFLKSSDIIKIIQIIFSFIMVFYIIFRLYKKNDFQIIHNKLDIFIILLISSTLIPIIFNTFISFSRSIYAVVNYLTLLIVYIFARETFSRKPQRIKWLKNIFIIITIILIFIGIENLNSNYIAPFLGFNNMVNGESRLSSIIGNPNTLASLIMFTLFISLNEMINEKHPTKKSIYSTCNSIFILGIILTYSKFVFLLFPIFLIIFIALLKSKEKAIVIVKNLFISLIMSLIYLCIYDSYTSFENYIGILILTIIWIIVIYEIDILTRKIVTIIDKINIKKISIIITSIILICSIWISIELHNGKALVVFKPYTTNVYKSKKIKNIEPNKKYKFSFDMDAYSDSINSQDDLFKIKIIQRNSKNLDEITSEEYYFNHYKGIKEFEIETLEETSEIKIEFTSNYKSISKTWIINNLKINDKNEILEYKHLPTKLVEKISDISLNYKTAQERFVFVKDCLKILKNNFITGYGGDSWIFKYKEVQDYKYNTNDPHSFYLQVWIEYGILGIISIFLIVFSIITIKYKDDNQKNNFIGLQIGLIAMLIHTALDSDMYYLYMKIVLFIVLGAVSTILTSKKTNKLKKPYSSYLLVLVCIIHIILLLKPEIYDKELLIQTMHSKNLNASTQYNLKISKQYQEIMKYEKYEPYRLYYATKELEYYVLGEGEDLETYLNKYYDYVIKYQNKEKYDEYKIICKSNYLVSIINFMSQRNDIESNTFLTNIATINVNEYDESVKNLEHLYNLEYKELKKQLNYIALKNNYNFSLDIIKSNSINKNIDYEKIALNNDIKLNSTDIIIYHSHPQESYLLSSKTSKNNIREVGNSLKEELEKKSINVIHINENSIYNNSTNAYKVSKKNVENTIEKLNISPDIIIDIHRDEYYENESDNWVIIENEKCAQLMFVVSTNHENWFDNLKWAVSIQQKADKLYPGLFKPILIADPKRGTYNQEITKYATIIEVGNNKNTLKESQNSMKYLANVIESVIKENI